MGSIEYTECSRSMEWSGETRWKVGGGIKYSEEGVMRRISHFELLEPALLHIIKEVRKAIDFNSHLIFAHLPYLPSEWLVFCPRDQKYTYRYYNLPCLPTNSDTGVWL